jgi:hypothetical protein
MLFTLVSILLAFVLKFVDRGPPLPPFGDAFTSIDCHSVKFESYNDRGGFLDFHFAVRPSVEFPPEYLPHFLSIKIETPPTTMSYSGEEITNITRDAHHISFSVVHTWAGPSTITAQCLHNPPQSLTGTLSDIMHYVPHFSRSDHPGLDHAKFRDVCLEYEKFLYFVQVTGHRPAVPFDDESLRFEMLKWPLDAYLKHKNVNMTLRTCFLVAPLDKTLWKMVLLTLIPLAISVEGNAKLPADPPLFIFRKEVPPAAPAVLRLFSFSKPVKLDDIMCFDTLLMTSTFSKLNDKESRIRRALELDLGPLRRRVPGFDAIPGRVILAENLWDMLEFHIKDRFPQIELIRLNATDNFTATIAAVGSAAVLIGDHISSLVHMLWLNANGTTVFDLTHQDYACNPWAQNMAQRIAIGYRSFTGNKSNCRCANFGCYLTRPAAPTVPGLEPILQELGKVLNIKE